MISTVGITQINVARMFHAGRGLLGGGGAFGIDEQWWRL